MNKIRAPAYRKWGLTHMEAAGKTTLEQGAEQRQAAAEKQTNKQNTAHRWGSSKTMLVCLFLFQKES